MDTEYIHTYGFGKALMRGSFGTNWIRFHLKELPSGDFELSYRVDPADETIRVSYDEDKMYIEDIFYHTTLSPFDQKMHFQKTIPAGNYVQIVLSMKNRYNGREYYSDTDED
jgi:hypothetical protein